MVAVGLASEQDLESIAALDEASGVAHGADALSMAVRESRCLIARNEGIAAGLLVFDRSFFGHFFIAMLKVHPDHRRRGIGSALMRAAESFCPSEKIFTSTNQSNLPMQALCGSLGFVISGYIDNLDAGDPEIVYFKRLGRHTAQTRSR